MQCTYRVNKIISHVFSVLVSARSELEGSIRCAAKPCTDMMQTSQLQMPRNQQQSKGIWNCCLTNKHKKTDKDLEPLFTISFFIYILWLLKETVELDTIIINTWIILSFQMISVQHVFQSSWNQKCLFFMFDYDTWSAFNVMKCNRKLKPFLLEFLYGLKL